MINKKDINYDNGIVTLNSRLQDTFFNYSRLQDTFFFIIGNLFLYATYKNLVRHVQGFCMWRTIPER